MATRTKRDRETFPRDFHQPEIDFLILADRAEGINGKLYMMGGGWQELYVNDFAQPVPLSMAVGVLVPWNATNEDHTVKVWVEHEDGRRLPPEVSAQLNVGRPPSAVPGQSFRAIIAVTGTWGLLGPGMYRAVALVGDAAPRYAAFRALPMPGQPPTLEAPH